VGLKKAVRPTPPLPVEEDEGGTYGLAQETSLSYLLQREHDGYRLSAEEKATKKRLLADRLAANPGQCPACEEKLPRDGVICVCCGLNIKTGKRLTTTVERPAEEGREGFELDREAIGEGLEKVLDFIIDLADDD
jgi:hypothetical protein